MSAKNTLEQMITLLTDAISDADKFDRGQDAAGQRLRAVLSTIASSSKTFRKEIQDIRTARKAERKS